MESPKWELIHRGISHSVSTLICPENILYSVIAILLLCALYLTSIQNYLLFHAIVELTTIVIVFAIFVIVWNTRRTITNIFFLIIGISFLFTGGIDFIHMLAYKGMGVFPGNSSDLPTQLWIAARYFQSIAFLFATLLIGKSLTKDRKYDAGIIFAVCVAAFGFLMASIFYWHDFPHCFIEGAGLTPFKIASEYVISLIMLATIVLLVLRRHAFDPAVWKLLVAAMACLIAGELAFTSYISVYGFMNMLGHLFKLVSVYFFYRAIVVVSITRPFDLLFRELKENEESLRESEQRYRSLFDYMIEGHALHEIILDQNGQATEYRILDVNTAFEKLLNVHREDVIGKLSCDAYRVNEPPFLKFYARVAASGQAETFETFFPPMEKHFLISVYSPQKGRFATIFEDITERKRAEEALRQSEKKYRQLIELAQEGIWTIDAEANTTFVNARMAEILGYTAEEMGGRSLFAFMDEHGVALAQANIERRRQGIREQHDFEFIRKDKKRVYTSLETTPLMDENGVYIGALAVVADITERKQADDALRETKNYLESLIGHANAPIIVWNPRFEITEFNRAFEILTGLSRGDVIGKPLSILFPAESQEKSLALIRLTLTGERWETVEIPVHHVSGDTRIVLWNSANVLDSSGTVIATIAQGQDITERKRANDVLWETKNYLESLIGHANAPIIVWNPRFEITEFNHACELLTGLSRGDVIGQPLSNLFPVQSRENSLNLISQTLAGEWLETVEIPILNVSGETHIVLWNSANILDSRGTVISTIAQGLDITERKRVEEALVASTDQLKLLLDSTAEAIYGLDMNGDCTFCNTACLHLLGYTHPEELIGKNMHRQIHHTRPDGASFPVEECRIFQAFQKGVGAHVDDEVLWRADGTSFPAEYWSYPQHRDGTIIGAVVTFLDITERKRAGDALRESEERFKAIFHNQQVGLLMIDTVTHTIIDANETALTLIGAGKEEVVGKICHTYICPAERGRCPVTDLGQTVDESERILINTKSERIPILKSVKQTEIGGRPYLIESFIDITERKKAEVALRNANRQLNLLSSITRHDILNQLTALRGYLELSQDVIDNPKTLLGYLEKELQAARSIEHQITFTKDYQDLGAAAPAWQNVNASITKAAAGLPLRGVRVEVDKHDPEIFTDPLFEKVFYNLIDNALRYGGEQMTSVRISSQESDAGLTILCEDDGIGITEGDKKRLFTKGFGKHTGLGLFLTREILAITGITITENGVPGKGARFEIIVPKGGYRFTGTR